VSPVIRVSAPSISRRGEEGFSSCSAYPRHRAVATTPPECSAASVRLRRSMLPSLHDRELGLWGHHFEATSAFTSLRPDDSLTIPGMALSIDSQDLVSFLLTIQATGPLTLALAGLTPAEYTSLTLDIQSCLLFQYLRVFAMHSERCCSPWPAKCAFSQVGDLAQLHC
jgi:hypothetical protein